MSRVLLLLLGLLAGRAHAGAVFAARTLQLPGATLEQVSGDIAPVAGGGLHVRLDADRLDLPAMGWHRVPLHLDGVLRRDPGKRWLLAGALQLRNAPGGAMSKATIDLQVDVAANTLLLDVHQSAAQATVAVPLDQPTHAQIQLRKLPFAWLQGLLGSVWSGRATGGRVDALMALDQRAAGLQASGQFSVAALGADATSGKIAAQGLAGSGRFSFDTTQGPARINLESTLRGGELLLGPIYANLPDHAVQLSMDARADAGALSIDRLRIGDPDAMALSGAMAFDARGNLRSLQLSRLQLDLPAAYDRYGKAWLATLGLRDVTVRGELEAALDLRDDGWHAFDFDTDGLDLADGDGRLAIQGLKGGLDWSRHGTRQSTDLDWQALAIYKLAGGPGHSTWQSDNGVLALQQPLGMDLLGGKVRVSQLAWSPGSTWPHSAGPWDGRPSRVRSAARSRACR